jgi:hypothetical protein
MLKIKYIMGGMEISIGFEGSASIVSNVSASINEAWNKFGSSEYNTSIYLGANGEVNYVQVGSTKIQQDATNSILRKFPRI